MTAACKVCVGGYVCTDHEPKACGCQNGRPCSYHEGWRDALAAQDQASTSITARVVRPLTVGDLRIRLAFRQEDPRSWVPSSTPVLIHDEQDYPVDEWSIDSDGLTLYANTRPDANAEVERLRALACALEERCEIAEQDADQMAETTHRLLERFVERGSIGSLDNVVRSEWVSREYLRAVHETLAIHATALEARWP